ncbi:carbohydrate ABC transporter permease [Phytohabitans flavus]|uniref:Sugar ABC transporter permease n=1 Tax=Phytohabitans flavus TaxID=1076124 RepID=A0A6F8XSJ7_9ACTN|nr:carbohydrate ABC transporter permease [Phytohabitans flavus]BCB76767.1 sugar ABC transporter permease [Phytohabitans flavus]
MSRTTSRVASDRLAWSHLALLPLAILWLLPIALLLNGALRTSTADIFSLSPSGLTLENLIAVWRETDLLRMFVNSTVVTIASVVAVVVLGSLAGFGLAFYRFRGSGIVLLILLSGIMLAPAAIIVPLYELILDLGMLNTYGALVGPYTALGLAASVLLYRNAFLALPNELREAASLDGAGSFRIYLRMYLPLARTATVTIAILQALASWNDYILALLFMTDGKHETVQLAFIAFQGQYFSSLPKQFAVMAIVMLPVLIIFLVAQRAFVSGLSAGAIK